MSYGNGVNGFEVFGRDANAITWINTDSQLNIGRNYVFNGVFNQVFVALHSEMATDQNGIIFTGSTSNIGSIYSEPRPPFTSPAIIFDENSKLNDVYLLNGRLVEDRGQSNRWTFYAADAGTGISGTTEQSIAATLQEATNSNGSDYATDDYLGDCNEWARGKLRFFQGSTGQKDSALVCAKDSADVYAWRTAY
jgi:hypothetical protein